MLNAGLIRLGLGLVFGFGGVLFRIQAHLPAVPSLVRHTPVRISLFFVQGLIPPVANARTSDYRKTCTDHSENS